MNHQASPGSFLGPFAAACLLSACATASNSTSSRAEVDAVTAADQQFYAALNGRDIQKMTAVWADKPFVVSIGPRSKTMDVGSVAVKKYWAGAFDYFSDFNVSKSDVHVHASGNQAWVIGIEHAVLQPKSEGEPLRFDTFVTHVFEKEDGHWLLVEHHAQMIPK
jgi:ketosteroid isomerase-like protein